MMDQRIAIFRKEHFNAAHRLHNPQLSDEENARLFGKCNYANYHGHNYELIVRVAGEIDPVTGYVMDTKHLSQLIKNLNLDTNEFRALNPTAENIAMVIFGILREQIDRRYDLKIILYETERNYVEYPC
jgi:6-pyruvoyltetrahydropterin/6-carboxytetrahydropterin synthase